MKKFYVPITRTPSSITASLLTQAAQRTSAHAVVAAILGIIIQVIFILVALGVVITIIGSMLTR